ncbi:hypothetical protein NGRA_1045 [Nosema granulosis]|uniref:FLYWCH-type domain-containing protein n=1 Tax=Nosema granulosis TaxID=83296 RepID=A0A9P6KZ06_9MICR|nr:hypothetical protein NGRA_1045 [Nosema granulosis]
MGIKYWSCNKRGRTSILKTNIRNELRDNGMHNHLTDEVKYYRTLLKQKMKTRALSSTESNRNVVLEVLKENVDAKMPLDLKYLNTYVNKDPRNNNYTISKDCDISSELKVIVENNQFLLYDSGLKNKNSVFVFSTEENIRHISLEKVLLCDGTFKTPPPSGFEQIFTIEIKIRICFFQ